MQFSLNPLSKFSALLSSSGTTLLLTLMLSAAQGYTADLLVACAADLGPLQDPLSKQFQQHTGIAIKMTLGASGMLAKQIEAGAPYDVFLSANERYVTELAASGRL